LVLVLVLAGCSAGSPAGSPPGSPAGPSADAAVFTNPVYDRNFPDPGVLLVDGVYHAYGTNGPLGNVPLLTSTDLVNWTEAGDVLPELGAWARTGDTWAPEAIRLDDGRFALYYTARSTATSRQCIGVAIATSPSGPFTDPLPAPLVCQADDGGSIDASPFRDADGSLYLHWKNDGNAIGAPTHLYGQRLAPDGLALTGSPVVLLTNTQPWHAHVIEAPQLFVRDGRYYLFYSANAYDADVYAVGYAECDGPLGPCRDAAENPILRSAPGAAGPGHCSVVTAPDGSTWLLYHAWPPDAIGSVEPGRTLWLDRLDWVDGKPVVRGPTADPQPLPAAS
jgi:beta-xylosidase